MGLRSYARLLHSWGWSLPTLLKGRLRGDLHGADYHRYRLRRIDSRWHSCVYLEGMDKDSGDHPRAPQGS